MQFSILNSFPVELEGQWNALVEQCVTHVPFLRFEYLRAWWQTRGGGEWPHAELALVTATENNALVGIAPLFRIKNQQDQAALMLVGSIEVTDYLDFIVQPLHLNGFVEGLLRFLNYTDQLDWQVLDLYNFLDSSPTMTALEEAARQLDLTFESQKLQHSPYIPLTGDWETYLEGIDKKQRHEIRRKMRRFESAPVKTGWYLTQDPAQLENDIDGFLCLMEQDPAKAAFLTPLMREHMRLVMRCAFERGCLNLAFLEVEGEKAAGYLSFDYLNRLWVYNSGLDRRFIEYSPGWVLLGYLLKWANENQRSEFDFMRGDEEYKYRFGAVDRFVLRARLTRQN